MLLVRTLGRELAREVLLIPFLTLLPGTTLSPIRPPREVPQVPIVPPVRCLSGEWAYRATLALLLALIVGTLVGVVDLLSSELLLYVVTGTSNVAVVTLVTM